MKAKSLKKVVSVLAAMTMLVVCFSAFTAVFAADTVIWNAHETGVTISNPTGYESTLDFTDNKSRAYIVAPNFKPVETGKIAFDFTYEPFTDTNTINASENVHVAFVWAAASNVTSSAEADNFKSGAGLQFIATSTTQLKVRFYLGDGTSRSQKKEDATTYKVGQKYHIVYETVADADSSTGYTTTLFINGTVFYSYETPSGMINNYTTQGSGLNVKPYNKPTVTINAAPESVNTTKWVAHTGDTTTINGSDDIANIAFDADGTARLDVNKFPPVTDGTYVYNFTVPTDTADGTMSMLTSYISASSNANAVVANRGMKMTVNKSGETATVKFISQGTNGLGGKSDALAITLGKTYQVKYVTVADASFSADSNYLGYTTSVYLDNTLIGTYAAPMDVMWKTNAGLMVDGDQDGNNIIIDTSPEILPEVIETFDFDAVSLSLKDNIAINFKADAAWFDGTNASYTNPYVKVTDENGDITTIDTYTVKDGKYVFTYDKIAAKMMGDVVSAVLYANGGEVESDALEYSVKQYCEDQKNTTDAALKTLLADMLVYGAATQIYDGYKTNALVTDGMDVSAATSATPTMNSVTDITTGMDNAAATWKAASLFLEESVTMRFKFTAESADGLTVKVAYEGGEKTITDFTKDGDRYVAEFNGFNPAQMREEVKVTVCSNGAAVSETLTYSIESYAAAKQNSTTAGLSDLVIAMMKYGDSTAAWIA